MEFVTTKINRQDYNLIYMFNKENVPENIPEKFTLEFWIKFRFNENNNIVKDLFDMYVYEDDESTDIENVSPYIRIYVDPEQENDYIVNINNKKTKIVKELLAVQWNHIALVWDKNTFCSMYLNGQLVIRIPMTDSNMEEFKDKKLYRFLWKAYKSNNDYADIYNIHMTLNQAKYNNTFTIRRDIKPSNYSVDWFTNTVTDHVKSRFEYSDPIYGPARNEDGYFTQLPTVITPTFAHTTCDIEPLIYLPMQNAADEDLGSLKISWTGNPLERDISEAIRPYYSYDSEEFYSRLQLKSEYKNQQSIIFNGSHESLFYTFTPYKCFGAYKYYNEKNEVIDEFKPDLHSEKILNTNDFQFLNETGFTLDWFSLSRQILYKYNNENIDYKDPLFIFSYLLTDEYKSDNYGKYDSRRYSNQWSIYTNAEKTETATGSLTSIIQQLIGGVNKENSIDTENNLYKNLNERRKKYLIKGPSNFDSFWGNIGLDNGIHHFALVFRPSKKIQLFFDGQLYELDKEFHGIVPDKTFGLCFNTRLNFSHFRMSPGCLWDNTFDPMADNRLFVQTPRFNSQRLSNIEEENISLLYPVQNPQTVYDTAYSTNINIDKDNSQQRANFQVGWDTTDIDKIIYDYTITSKGEHKPTKYQGYPAITSNTYTDNYNVIEFRNNHLENEVPWTVEVWVYLEQKRQVTVPSTPMYDLVYLTGYGLNTTNNTVNNKIGNLAGIGVNYWGQIYYTYPQGMFLYAGRYFPKCKYGTDGKIARHELSYENNPKFNFNNWNHIAYCSAYWNHVHYYSTAVYLNGTRVQYYSGPITNLHKIFLYLGNMDAMVKPYYTGLKVTIGESKYFNGDPINSSKEMTQNWIDC